MFYSSGTTGRPKGIKPELTGQPFGTGLNIDSVMRAAFGFSPETVYLSPGPLYHAAPLGWSLGTVRNGGTVIVMERFDASGALELIERYKVTRGQFVPTMFVRMLKLPQAERDARDVSSLRLMIHAAAPISVEVKEQMIEWFGPILTEFYAGSEGNGFCMIDSPAWLAHKGSVGQPLVGQVHICSDDGAELPAGEIGTIWFSGTNRFTYHNDPEKTATAYNSEGWSTLGDMGYVDSEGYLYLADRRTDLILSGGVNIYPREVEDALAMHPAVADVAVIGIPDDEMGQRVHAIVQPAPGAVAGPGLASELIEFCRSRIAHFKAPKSVSFSGELPRTPSGKMLRRVLAERHRRGVRDGDDWIVSGAKTFISSGINADLVVVVTRTDPEAGHRGFTLLVVERGMPGFKRGRKLAKMGQHSQDTAELFFDQVRVPAANVLGEVNRGFYHLMHNLPSERMSIAVNAVAAAREVFDQTLEYAKSRQAFGQPIGSFQYNRFRFAEMETELDIAQAYVDRCLAAIGDGELTAVDAAKAKWWTTELQKRVVDTCLQLHGGYGYMTEYAVSRAYTDSRIQTIYGGTTEIMKDIVGKSLGL